MNTPAAELLYATAGDLANLDGGTTLIDVCCGTGTIGLCLASRCKKVVGVELLESAVVDARQNAKRNSVTNAEFFAGRAEFLLPDILRKLGPEERAVAIVDPPRAGLHHKAIKALRASGVGTVVFVSCDAGAAMGNFVSLVRPTSNGYPGDPFIPRRVVPVDLFPNTNHFELVIVFERAAIKKKRQELSA